MRVCVCSPRLWWMMAFMKIATSLENHEVIFEKGNILSGMRVCWPRCTIPWWWMMAFMKIETILGITWGDRIYHHHKVAREHRLSHDNTWRGPGDHCDHCDPRGVTSLTSHRSHSSLELTWPLDMRLSSPLAWKLHLLASEFQFKESVAVS